MQTIVPPKFARVLFDEFHSESWTVSEQRAREINPANPQVSSFQKAAHALAARDFEVSRNVERPLLGDVLAHTDVLLLPHPCDPKWERTTSANSPRMGAEELDAVCEFVRRGGGLIVISEYEHEKYGNNLNELLAPFGLAFENNTVEDVAACIHENPEWFVAGPPEPLFNHLATSVCYYRGCSVRAEGASTLVLRASMHAQPERAGLIGVAKFGEGRVVAVGDSLFLGDRRFAEHDHQQLWLNLVYWCAAPAFHRKVATPRESGVARSEAWKTLKGAVNELRAIQNDDGSVTAARHADAVARVQTIRRALNELAPHFPQDAEYLAAVARDFDGWVAGGFGKPDFTAGLAAFNPQVCRRDGLEHLVLWPMYTPNSSNATRFEAILYRVPWPDWFAQLERTSYQNPKFVPGHLVDFTEGYRSECAVLFPETVSVAGRPTNNFATIFCDREARRLRTYATKAAQITALELHPQLECWLGSLPMMQHTVALWDLIHDKSHSLGELPFDPFMIRQKAPFWMYALEELRVDLRSFCEAGRLAREGFPFALYVTYAVLLDRIFRFPITGNRVRNYDALGGQLLFSYLHKRDVLVWRDNRLTIKWDALIDTVAALRDEIIQLYKDGADISRLAFWINAHDLISKYLQPSVASRWRKETRAITDEAEPKKWIALVCEDEFPLGGFHQFLQKKMALSLA
ncbi:MAG TPA: DUF6421 family protein [Verrucomicrobiae bacterium]|jgi:hypothetical protein